MLKTILPSFSMAIGSPRNRFFHSLLSVLGIVIGIGALVAILSQINGMGKYAHEQITNTISIKAISIDNNSYHDANGVRVKKENPTFIKVENFQDLKKKEGLAEGLFFANETVQESDKIKQELEEGKSFVAVDSKSSILIDSVDFRKVLEEKIIIEDSILFQVIGN